MIDEDIAGADKFRAGGIGAFFIRQDRLTSHLFCLAAHSSFVFDEVRCFVPGFSLLRKLMGELLLEIGKEFKLIKHSSVSSVLERVRLRLKQERIFRKRMIKKQ